MVDYKLASRDGFLLLQRLAIHSWTVDTCLSMISMSFGPPDIVESFLRRSSHAPLCYSNSHGPGPPSSALRNRCSSNLDDIIQPSLLRSSRSLLLAVCLGLLLLHLLVLPGNQLLLQLCNIPHHPPLRPASISLHF